MGKRAKSEAGESAAASTAGELPRGWCWATVGEVCQLINGRAFKPDEWRTSGLPIIRIQNLNNPSASFNHFDGDLDARHRVASGDLLFAWSGTPGTSFGAHLWSRGAAALNQHIFKVIEQPCVTRGFLMRALNFRLDQLIGMAHGGAGLAHVTKPVLESTAFPLPPLAEQRRIVAKLEALLGRIRRAREALDAVPAMVERYKKSVLGAAFRGELSSTTTHPAIELPTSDDDPVAVRAVARAEPIPATWRWYAVQELASGDDRSIQSGPFGSMLLHSEFQSEGRLVVGIDNVQDGEFSVGAEHRISQEKFEQLRKYSARGGDVLITVMATVGRVCVVPEDLEPAIITKHVYRITPNRHLVSPRILMEALRGAPIVRVQLFASKRGQTRDGINGSILRSIKIPLPPLDEQRAIVARIDAAFARARAMLDAATTARAELDALERSVLAKAFRGELVEQDPADEPAAVMLDRVRAERSEPVKKPRKPRASA